MVCLLVSTLTPFASAQLGAAPSLVVEARSDMYQVGDLIVVDIAITNESDAFQQFGAIGPVPSGGRLRLTVDTAAGMPSH